MPTKYSIPGLQSGKFFPFLQRETPGHLADRKKISGFCRQQNVSIKKERDPFLILSFYGTVRRISYPIGRASLDGRHCVPCLCFPCNMGGRTACRFPLYCWLFLLSAPSFLQISDAKRRCRCAAFPRISFPIRQGHIPLLFQTGALSPQIPQNAAARWPGICEAPQQCPKTPDG